MANHSPEPDNYVQNKTWDEVVEGKKPEAPKSDDKKTAPEPKRNEARGNGGGN